MRRSWRGFCILFQAEDGIRDADVTGVQTCALPILTRQRISTGSSKKMSDLIVVSFLVFARGCAGMPIMRQWPAGKADVIRRGRVDSCFVREIGRASCREGV